MDNRISTSVQYQYTNNILFGEVFMNWPNFDKALSSGPSHMKKYLLDSWNTTKERLAKDDRLILKDIDSKVTIDDFDVTYTRTQKGIHVFFFTFPDYDYTDGASKYVAVALTEKEPSYFTLEYSEHILNHEPCWVIGEFAFENKEKVHHNHTTVDNKDLSTFAKWVIDHLDSK